MRPVSCRRAESYRAKLFNSAEQDEQHRPMARTERRPPAPRRRGANALIYGDLSRVSRRGRSAVQAGEANAVRTRALDGLGRRGITRSGGRGRLLVIERRRRGYPSVRFNFVHDHPSVSPSVRQPVHPSARLKPPKQRSYEWTDVRANGWIEGRTNGRTNGPTEGRSGRTDRRMFRCVSVASSLSTTVDETG